MRWGFGRGVLAGAGGGSAGGGRLNRTPEGGGKGTGVLADFGGSRGAVAQNCGCGRAGGGRMGWGFGRGVLAGCAGGRMGWGCGRDVLAGAGGGRADGGWLAKQLTGAGGGELGRTPGGGGCETGLQAGPGGGWSTEVQRCGCGSAGDVWSTAAQGCVCGWDREVGVGVIGVRIGGGVGGVGGEGRDWSLRSCVCPR